jgi:hypothetical protein
MAGFEMRHPVGMTTHVFQPGSSFEVGRSGQARDDLAIGKVLDQEVYSYAIGSAAVWVFTRSLAALTQANMTALEAFLDAVARDVFEFTDGTCGPITGWQKVKLAPESFVRAYEYRQGQRQAVQLVMREHA